MKLGVGVNPAILLVEKPAMLHNVTKCTKGNYMFVRKVTHQQMFSLFGLMFGLGFCVIKGKFCLDFIMKT